MYARLAAVGLDDPQRRLVRVLGGEHAVEPVDGEVEVLGPRPANPRHAACVVGAWSSSRSRAARSCVESRDVMVRPWHARSVKSRSRPRLRATAAGSRSERVIGARRSPRSRRPGPAGGMPNASRSPCTTSDGHTGSVELVAAGSSPAGPAGAAGTPARRRPVRRSPPRCGRPPGRRWSGRRRRAAARRASAPAQGGDDRRARRRPASAAPAAVRRPATT